MSIVRKPHNLVTSYWDDSHFFSKAASSLVPRKIEQYDYLSPEEKRVIRYAILSSFLFLEAFINAEYFDEMGYVDPRKISLLQKQNLDQILTDTYFEDKWSNWIENISKKGKQQLKGTKEFQKIKKLKDWRNHLTHYKIHNLMLVANDIETIANAIEANQTAKLAIAWYYNITGKNVPDWINRDILLK
ncbi:MAG: hypothetical protein BGO70_18205 [Bacteroidetes bacterium 43-93]|nr:hypothetical protein [Bacteroidota bacterium]OJX01666.1 MAG: hypothetical protein BGO70_18205 [Bacteroidetes bacterium 43-93]